MSLDDIRAREQTASVGPWKVYNRGIGYEVEAQDGERLNNGFRDTFTGPDAEFIAHAREDIPKLLAALDAVQELARVRQNLGYSLDPEEIQGAIRQALQ